MTSGVLLLAWGKRGYGFMAYNLALSIKHFSPNVPITLIASSGCMSQVPDKSVFDQIIYDETPVTDPGRHKVSIYNKLPYDHNLYLDVDAICLNTLEPLLERLIKGSDYYATFIHAVYDRFSPNDLPLMYWATRDVIWSHYQFTDEKLPATQSSIQYIRKCPESEALFNTIESCFDNPIPIELLRYHWGGTQPDELYLNVALAKHGIAPHIGNETMWFGDNLTQRPHQVAAVYNFLSLYGNKNKVKALFWEYYDKRIGSMAALKGEKGFSSASIKPDKHANGGMNNLNAMKRHVKSKFRHAQKPVQISPIISNEGIKKSGMVFLYTSFFDSKNVERNKELASVMQRNIDNPFIDRIINLGSNFDHPKVLNLPYERPTYSDFVNVARSLQVEYSIIANTDIFFDASIELIKDHLTEDSCFALSRFDINEKGHPILFNYEWSQDTWIFKGKIKPIENIDFVMGKPACDNRFAFELNKAGYSVSNPAKSIATYHLHQIGLRTYTEADRLPGEVMPVFTSQLTMKEPITIIQPGKVGDILIVLPIAKHYHDLGHKVYWIVPEKYRPMFDYIDYVTVVDEAVEGSRIIDLSFGINQQSDVHKLWMKRRNSLDSFVTLKYELAGVPIEKLRKLEYNRNLQKEIELWDMVYPRDNYILVHSGSDYGRTINIDSDLVVDFYPIEGYTIFDWRKVIENASEIHCIDSSLANFVDSIPDLTAELFYYPTDKVPHQSDRTILVNNWTTKKPKYANS